MSGWRETLLELGSNVEGRFDELRHRLRDRLGSDRPVLIVPYRGFGTRTSLNVRGRVLADKGLRASTDNDTVWDNLLSSYRRIGSAELPNVRVGVRYGANEDAVVTDHEGYFACTLAVPEGLPDGVLHHQVEVYLLDEVDGQTGVRATCDVVVPAIGCDFGIISDIDDTVLKTGATDLLTMARRTFMENARTRQPFDGVDTLYEALQAGPDPDPVGLRLNPLFYVSSSPWNLYDLLTEFMDHNDIPPGPLFLQDFGLEPGKLLHGEHLDHKLKAIARVMETYPELSFVLIGDSGQKDPEVYSEVVARYPGRVAAIYIRDVSPDDRDAEVEAIAAALGERGVPMALVADSEAAMEHAAAIGLIPARPKTA